jgi:flagellar hook-basal body complex protein FliE
LVETPYQDHEVTSILGLIGMAIDMADQEEKKLEQEENDGEIHEDMNEAEEAENLAEQNRQLRNQVVEVYQQITIYQETSDSSTE